MALQSESAQYSKLFRLQSTYSLLLGGIRLLGSLSKLPRRGCARKVQRWQGKLPCCVHFHAVNSEAVNQIGYIASYLSSVPPIPI